MSLKKRRKVFGAQWDIELIDRLIMNDMCDDDWKNGNDLRCVCTYVKNVDLSKRGSERNRPSIVFKIYNNNLSTTHQQPNDQHLQLFTFFREIHDRAKIKE